MPSIFEEILKRVDNLAVEIAALKITEGAGTVGGGISGSGTTGRITQWSGTGSLTDSTLIKTGVGVLTLTSDTDYTVTVAGTASISGTNTGDSAGISAGLLTTRGDIIRRNATVPERYALSVPAAGTLNYLGVNNGEVDPTWKSASSNPGAAESLLASTSAGYLQLVRLGVGGAPTNAPLEITASGDGAELARFNIDRAWALRQSGTAGSTKLQFYSLTAGKFLIINPNDDAAGNGGGLVVGNAPTPAERLHVYGNGNVKILCESGSTTGYAFMRIKNNLGYAADFGVYGSASVSSLFGFANLANKFLIAYASGDVILGTTAAFPMYFGTNGAIRGTFGAGGGLTITGGTDTQQLIVKNNATQTTNPFELHPSGSTTPLAYLTPTGGAVFNESGDAAGDFRVESDTEINMLFVDANGNTDGQLFLGGSTNGFVIDKGGVASFIGTAQIKDATNIPFGSTTGTKIGTATTQKIGFWNATPIVQPAGATQAAPAAYATGAFGLDSNANMQALYDLVVAMRTALVNAGIMKGAA